MSIGTKLSELLQTREMKAIELAKKAKVPQSTVYSILTRNNVRIDVDALNRMAAVLGVTLDYFVDSKSDEVDEPPAYYLNSETAQIAQEIYDNPEMRILFDASRKATPEDLKKIAEMARIMSGGDYGDDGDDIG